MMTALLTREIPENYLFFFLETIYEAQQRELNPTRFGVSRFNQSLP